MNCINKPEGGQNMRLEYDPEVDAAYLYLMDAIPPGGAATTLSVDPADINGEVNIDLDSAGRIIGIEVLDASRLLPEELIVSRTVKVAEARTESEM